MHGQYNYNEAYLYPKHPCSARELSRMIQQRNPIIETDKNVEELIILMRENQKVTNKQFKIALIVSIIAALFAAGSFVIALFK